MFKNWKTTLLGLVAAVTLTFGTMAQNRAQNPGAAPITTGNVLPAIAIAALGAVARDASKGDGQ
jgi:hypothetical protein